MRERAIVKSIREQALKEFGIRLHKATGGPFGEIGAADLFGTISPSGVAIYVEVKRPGASLKSIHVQRQLRWLAREMEAGAFTALVDNYEDLREMLVKSGLVKLTKTI
jgi:hypothetical protein